MYKKLRKALLVILPIISLICFSIFAVACGEKPGTDTQVTYSVTVTLDDDVSEADVTLTSIKAQWSSNGTVVAEVALNSEGKAYKDLDAGVYTVTLGGVPETLTYDPATVNAVSPRASIVLKNVGGSTLPALAPPTGLAIDDDGILTWNKVTGATGYEIFDGNTSLGKVEGENTLSFDLSDKDLSYGPHTIYVVALGDNENHSNSPKTAYVNYNLEDPRNHPDGAGTDYWYDAGAGWEHHEDGEPYKISALDTYYISVKYGTYTSDDEVGSKVLPSLYAHVIEFTAPEDGEHSYTFTWDSDIYSLTYLNSDSDVDEADDCLEADEDNGSLVFSLTKGTKVRIVLQYNFDVWSDTFTEGQEFGFELTVESGEAIPFGSEKNPVKSTTIAGEHKLPQEHNDLTEAYFRLPVNETGRAYTITFAAGVSVDGSIYNPSTWGDEHVDFTSGSHFVPNTWKETLLHVTVTSGTEMKFTLEKYIVPGSIDDPLTITKDETKTADFTTSEENAWYKFTPATAGWYRIEADSNVEVYGKLTYNEEWDMTFADEQVGGTLYPDGQKDVYLEADKIYYIQLYYNGAEATIKVIDTPNEEGGVLNPKTLSLGETSVNIAEIGVLYAKYTADFDGLLNFFFGEEIYYFEVYVYVDDHFSVYQNPNLDSGYMEEFTLSVESGDVLYFFINFAGAKREGYLTDTLTIELTKKLATPTNVVLNGKVITWSPVANATGYAIYKDGELLDDSITEETYTIPNSAGDGEYAVMALGNTENYYSNSSLSEAVEYSSNVTYVLTVEDEFDLTGLKVELYKFDPEQPNSCGDKVGEADVVNGKASIAADADFYVAVLVGFDEDVYTCDTVVLGESTEGTLTVAKVVYIDCSIEIEGLDKLADDIELYVQILDSDGKVVMEVKIDDESLDEHNFVTVKLKDGFYGSATLKGLPDGFVVYGDDLNTKDKATITLYIAAQPTLELDSDWVDVEVLASKVLNFNLGESIQLNTEYYIMIDPESVLDQGPEFTVNYGEGSSVTLTPAVNYWSAVSFSSLKLSLANFAEKNLVLKFKLVSTKPATLIEEGGKVSLQLTVDTVGEFTTGASVVDGNYLISLDGTDMLFAGTVTVYIGPDDQTGYTFTRQNMIVSPSSHKVHLQPGVVIRVVVSRDTGVTISLAKALEGKELTLSGFTDGMIIDLSEETAGSSVVYTINVTANIVYNGNGYLMMKGPGMGAPLPLGVKVTVDFGGGVTASADGSDYGVFNKNFYSTDEGKISNTWTMTIEIAAGTTMSNLSFNLMFDPSF